MAGTVFAKLFDQERMEARADWLAVAVCVSLPWSTSAGPVAGLVGNEGGVVSGVINLESSGVERRTGDHAMTSITTKPDSSQPAAEMAVDLFDNWFDPIETEVRAQARGFIEELIRGELDAVLARPRFGRIPTAGDEGRAGVAGHRHGSRRRSLTGTFGPIEIRAARPAEHARGQDDRVEEPGAARLSASHVGGHAFRRQRHKPTRSRRFRGAITDGGRHIALG